MSGRVVHFEIGGRDTAKAAAFYKAAFGCTASPYLGPALHAHTGKPETISGFFNALGHEPHNYVTLYIEADDMAAVLDRTTQAGGAKIVGPMLLPSGQSFAWIKDPDGNIMALITPQP